MKKLLLASSALVASAGVASAEISWSGYAEMGIGGGTTQTAEFIQDIALTFSMSGMTDNGIEFGASSDLDTDSSGQGSVNGTWNLDNESVFISGAWGTLTMGEIDGAMDWALTEAAVGNPGSLNDDETAHAGYMGSYLDGQYDNQIVRYDYTMGDFGFAVSAEMDDTDVRDPGMAIGAKYSMALGMGSLDLAAGYQQTDGFSFAGLNGNAGDEATVAGISAVLATDAGLTVGVEYTDWDFNGQDATHVGVGAGYTMDAITLHANWGQYDLDGLGEITGYGLAAAYDLGGGAALHLAYGDSEDLAGNDSDSWSFGLSMSF
ncbi:porin [Rhodovulum sp. YNF3179]|uniref:porin n=1 Tax=Rhodovulum sp. YNF3179 TaxID=3425127 RepID=UPI003D33901D